MLDQQVTIVRDRWKRLVTKMKSSIDNQRMIIAEARSILNWFCW